MRIAKTQIVKICKRAVPMLGLLIVGLAVRSLHRELSTISFAELRDALAAACGCVALNYAILTLNDKIALSYNGASVPYPRAAFASFVSNTIGFNVGASFISGGRSATASTPLPAISASRWAVPSARRRPAGA